MRDKMETERKTHQRSRKGWVERFTYFNKSQEKDHSNLTLTPEDSRRESGKVFLSNIKKTEGEVDWCS